MIFKHRLTQKKNLIKIAFVMVLLLVTSVASALAHPDDGEDDGSLHRHDPSTALSAHDLSTANIVSDGPNAKVTKNLAVAGRGERLERDATTDVWAHNGYAYTGTFNSPCGGNPEAGVWVWDVGNKNKPEFATIIPSPTGSRSNDVRVASMNSGDILVHSNESCGGGPGGFEIYNVNDPASPMPLASVRIDDPIVLGR